MPASSGVRGKVPPESHLPDSRGVISMNTRALCATVRSLYYRQRLARDLPQLEETLRVELCSRGLTNARLGGYLVQLAGDELFIQLAPSISPGQLRLPGVENE